MHVLRHANPTNQRNIVLQLGVAVERHRVGIHRAVNLPVSMNAATLEFRRAERPLPKGSKILRSKSESPQYFGTLNEKIPEFYERGRNRRGAAAGLDDGEVVKY